MKVLYNSPNELQSAHIYVNFTTANVPPVTAFQGVYFWAIFSAAVVAMALLRHASLLSSKARSVVFLLLQFALVIWGFHIPAIVLAVFVCGSLVVYGITVASRSGTLLSALALVLGLLTLGRQQAVAGAIHAMGSGAPWVLYLLVGFSYLALRMVSFVLDRQAGKIESPSWITYLAYLLFAPTFVSGPIDRYSRFAGDFNSPKPLSRESVLDALQRIAIGLVKKVVFVGFLSGYALRSDTALAAFSTGSLWISLYAFAGLLYLDFSGYSDLAIGTGRLLGIEVPENFRWPYFKRNIIEFWNAWHITLSQWLRDYLFLPAGQVLFRVSWLRAAPLAIAGMAYLLTMALCGLWHGFAIHFLVWGLYHGAGLWICKASKGWWSRWWVPGPSGQVLSTLITFHFVAIGWLFFLYDVPTALSVLRRLFGGM